MGQDRFGSSERDKTYTGAYTSILIKLFMVVFIAYKIWTISQRKVVQITTQRVVNPQLEPRIKKELPTLIFTVRDNSNPDIHSMKIDESKINVRIRRREQFTNEKGQYIKKARDSYSKVRLAEATDFNTEFGKEFWDYMQTFGDVEYKKDTYYVLQSDLD